MSFGKTLKRIRLKHKDSLRGLAKKIDLHFTFIDKVEKGTAPISKNFIENVIAVYPDERGYMNMDSPDYYMPILRGNFSKRSFFVEITGNSMEPTLEDGEFALVDPDNTAYSKNKIYVVTYNDEGYIKRLEMNNKLKLITLKSDNPDYEDIDIPEEMQEYFTVNGRVVEVISKKKLL